MAKRQVVDKAAPAAKQQAVVATLPEMVPTQQDGIRILDFFNGLVQFSQRAMALELRAKATLAEARALTAPTSKDEDEQIQIFIRRAAADEKEVDGHWTVTKIISAFHKRLTTARARATGPLEDAKNIAQKLHNNYAESERRRVEAEAAAERRRLEEEAANLRRKELEDLEASAIRREQDSPDISEREQRFVDLVVDALERDEPIVEADLAVRAARGAGYKDGRHGLKLIVDKKIKAAVRMKREALALRRQQQAIAEKPLDVREVEVVEAQVGDAGSDRTKWGAEVFDIEKWRAGLKAGTIPLDTAIPSGPKMNEYGRALHENIDRWPGCRHTKNTRTV